METIDTPIYDMGENRICLTCNLRLCTCKERQPDGTWMPLLCPRCNKPKRMYKDIQCKCGRPPSYSKEIVEKTIQYVAKDYKIDELFPTIEGLAVYLMIARSTIYKWKDEEDKGEFSDIIEALLSTQAKALINGGINGRYNSTITKVMMTKHGLREGVEYSGENGSPIKMDISKQLEKVYGSIVDEVPDDS